jgi:hypothetical protein
MGIVHKTSYIKRGARPQPIPHFISFHFISFPHLLSTVTETTTTSFSKLHFPTNNSAPPPLLLHSTQKNNKTSISQVVIHLSSRMQGLESCSCFFYLVNKLFCNTINNQFQKSGGKNPNSI